MLYSPGMEVVFQGLKQLYCFGDVVYKWLRLKNKKVKPGFFISSETKIV